MTINKEELEKFLNYLCDKVQECYKQEVQTSIQRFMEGEKQ